MPGLGLGLSLPARFARRGLAGVIDRVFSQNQIGWAYDHHDDSTLFTDSAGTTPAVLEDPIGLQLDKSKGLKLGPELVTNGTFDTDLSGWVSSGSPNAVQTNGVMRLTATGSTSGKYQDVSAGHTSHSEITFKARKVSGSSAAYLIVSPLSAFTPQNVVIEITSSEWTTLSARITPQSGGHRLYFQMSAGDSVVEIDNVSVRELPGNHRSQSVSADRPILSARYNQLTKTEDFADGAWTKHSVVVGANVSGPFTGDGAGKITPSTENLSHSISQPASSTGLSRLEFYAKADGYDFLGLTFNNSTSLGVFFNLADGTVSNVGASLTSYGAEDAGDGWYKVWIETDSTVSSTRNYVGPSASFGVFSGDGVSGVILSRASLIPAQEASLPYQRINTATDYDSDKAKFPRYLSCNGTNQWMKTAQLDFTSSDQIAVFAGVRKLQESDLKVLLEFSETTANNGSFGLYAPRRSSQSNWYGSISRGTANSDLAITDVTFRAPVSSCLGQILDISTDTNILRADGTQEGSSTQDQGTGNYGNYVLYFFSRAGTDFFFLGREYSSIGRLGPITADEINAIEKYIAGRVPGVTV